MSQVSPLNIITKRWDEHHSWRLVNTARKGERSHISPDIGWTSDQLNCNTKLHH